MPQRLSSSLLWKRNMERGESKEEDPVCATEVEETTADAKHANGGGHDDDDDIPCLSAYAVAALQEFLLENQSQNGANHKKLEEEEQSLEDELVKEDWRLSQFWYDSTTALTIAYEVCHLARVSGGGESSSVACIACPTLYVQLKRTGPELEAKIFEFDKRFEKYGTDFIFYDYNKPEYFPSVYKHKFQVVVADPPYLSEECLLKVSKTMTLLGDQKNVFFLLLTGKVQEELAAKLLNLRPCGFRPTHCNKLGNEFMLFTNYNPEDRLGGWENSC